MAKSFDVLKYYRLYREGGVVGFKRIIAEKGSTQTVEYLRMGGSTWVATPISHDPGSTIALSSPPLGVENLKRSKS